MPARNEAAWIPITYDTNLITRDDVASVIEKVGTRKNMTSDTVEQPRLLSGQVGGGSTLFEDTTDPSKVTMYSYQYNNKVTLDEAASEDSFVDDVNAYNANFLKDLKLVHDNACLGVSGARSTTATDYRPFPSVYYTLTHADSTAGYTANANVLTPSALTYDVASGLLKKLETSRFGNPRDLVVISHPALRDALRRIKADTGMPIFKEGATVNEDTLFGRPIEWTLGAIKTANFQQVLSGSGGNPLIFVANRNHLIDGHRVEPQARFITASINTTVLEHTIQHRARKGFVLTVPQAAAVLEVNA